MKAHASEIAPAAATAVRELHYRVGAPVLGHFPGHHRSPRGDSGFEFRGHVPLMDAPDARRLDLHASLRDPFGNWIVRVYSQRKAIAVSVVADLSASMGFAAGTQRRLDVLADFVESLAWSAWRTGDSFGFVGCDEAVNPALLLRGTRARGAGKALAQGLRGLHPQGRSAAALQEAHRYLGRQRSLVFLVSDFHLPLDLIEQVAASLARHELVPVVLWESREFGGPGARGQGIAHVVDPETGKRRLLWWRPALRDGWLAAWQQRREALLQLFARQRCKPLFIEGAFDADAVTRYFHHDG